MLGLELLDTGALAVAVDDAGLILGRADVAGADVALAASAAAERASASSATVVAVASNNPESPASIAAMRILGERFRGSLMPGGALASGTAAAVAEAWVGAARGAKEVVYFGVASHTSAGILRNGLPVTGAHRRAASVAWLALNPVEREDYRRAGCLEAEVAASGIVTSAFVPLNDRALPYFPAVVHVAFAIVPVRHFCHTLWAPSTERYGARVLL